MATLDDEIRDLAARLRQHARRQRQRFERREISLTLAAAELGLMPHELLALTEEPQPWTTRAS